MRNTAVLLVGPPFPNAAMNLEDSLGDIVGKARRGRGMSRDVLAELTGLTAGEIGAVEAYRLCPPVSSVRRIAAALGLRADALAAISQDAYVPAPPDLGRWGCVSVISSRFGDMSVNAYLVWDTLTHDAALFDTGTDFEAIASVLGKRQLRLRLLGITHTHSDHVAILDDVRRAFGPVLLSSPREPVPGSRTVCHGETIPLGSLEIEVLETEGHSPGGLSYYVTGFRGAAGVAAVGDALFAGSAGGAGHSYETLMRNIHSRILALPDDTLLLPGHGPVSTVAQERESNPFAPLDG